MSTPTESPPSSPAVEALGMFLRSPSAVAGLALLSAIVLVSVIGPLIHAADPFAIVATPMAPPGAPGEPLGSNYLGQSIWAGILHGGHIDLVVGAMAALLSVTIGISVGALAGFYGRRVDEVLMRITEFFQVIPTLLFAMVLVAVLSPTLPVIALAIGIVSWPRVARIARAEFMKVKQIDYVTAERAIGAGNVRIIWKSILPNALPPLIVQATLEIGNAILFAAGLSFLGLSDPNTMSWGYIIGANRPYILNAWWTVTIPGVAIFLTVLAVSLIGDGLNDALNPKLRER